ncbi:MAG: rhodanese-like domain-containing protein [Legionellaceae bacterium]|nr:rhodanese-like domain-containing protein [Legionellaceae bacterium]
MISTEIYSFVLLHWERFALLAVLLLVILAVELRAKRNKGLTPLEVVQAINHAQALVLDVRDKEAFDKGHIVGSRHHMPESLSKDVLQKYKKKNIILVCQQGNVSSRVAADLRKSGLENVSVLQGGIQAWQAAELPLGKG